MKNVHLYMNVNQSIQSYSHQPITHQLLTSLLREYKRPNDKIHSLVKEGVLKPVKRGLYITGPELKKGRVEPFLLANHILGPSYVSIDTALAYYGLIPELVYEISSVTTKARRKFNTPIGVYSYTYLPLPYYAFGIKQVKLGDEQYAMVASPEKALFDKVITTSGIVLRSVKNAASYFLEDLRMDEDSLKELDMALMISWLPDAPKRDSLQMVVKMIESL